MSRRVILQGASPRPSQPLSNRANIPFEMQVSAAPLSFTLHTESFSRLSRHEAVALEVIRSLSRVAAVELSELEEAPVYRLEVGEVIHEKRSPKGSLEDRQIAVPPMAIWQKLVEGAVLKEGLPLQKASEVLKSHLFVRAHLGMKGHLFITRNQDILRLQARLELDRANIVSPTEAAALIGLYLRGLGNYTLVATPSGLSVNKSLFFWVLARTWLKDNWRFVSCCAGNRSLKLAEVSDLAFGVLERCQSALCARDEILRYACLPCSPKVLECAYYHFEYLALLLAGAFDALASIAAIAYGCPANSGGWPSFRNKAFRDSLAERSSPGFKNCIHSGDAVDILQLLYEVRNLIHANPPSRVTQIGSRSGHFFQLHPKLVPTLRDAARRQGSLATWGFNEEDVRRIDIFVYAQALVIRSFDLLNRMMATFDIEPLLPRGAIPEDIGGPPPNDHIFGGLIARNICVLGGIVPPEHLLRHYLEK